MNVGDRMKQRRKELRLSAEDVADKIGVNRSTVFRYEKGEIEKLPIEILEPLSEVLRTTPQFLMGWDEQPDIIPIYNQLEHARQEKVYNYAEQELKEQNKVIDINKYSKDDTEDDIVEETMEGYLSAGTGEFLAEDIKEPIRIHKSLLPEQHYDMILQVNGDSMEPMFEDHEYVFIRTAKEIRSGQIGVFIIDGESLLKKAYINDDHLRLVSLNKKYDDLIFDSVNDIHLIGTVVM